MIRPSPRYPAAAFWVRIVQTLLIAGLAGVFSAPQLAVAPAFTAGNLVVLRVGAGGAALNSAATAVFLDEYSIIGGPAVQTIALPTVVDGANRVLTNSGSATSEGALNRSADGRYLTLVGYDAAPGTASVVSTTSAAVNRIVARVDSDGIVNTSTRISDGYSASNIRGVISDDGTRFWTAGTASGTLGGVRFVPFGNNGPPTTLMSSAPTNTRVPNIYNNQLYVSSASGANIGVNTVGSGLPTTGGQTTTLLPGVTTAANAYAYALFDRDASVAGPDTLYVADQSSGLMKFSFDGTTWTARGAIPGNLTGLTGVLNASSVTLFATNGTGAGNALITFTDGAPFNVTISAGSFTTLATAPSNTAFRGVAIAPSGAAPPPTAPDIVTHPANESITEGASATLTVAATGTAPLSYQWYRGITGDTSAPVGADSPSFTTPALFATTSYWVRVSNSVDSDDSATATITVTVAPVACSAADTPIHSIQGSSEISPFAAQVVTVQGVVVGDYEGANPALNGFYLQDLSPDADPATSEGIFVFHGNADTVSLGQVVQVTGNVTEFQGQTEITPGGIENCGTTSSVQPVDITLPVPAPVAGVAYLERFEGMLAKFPQTLYVTEHFQLGRFGQIVMSSDARLPQPTNIVFPGAPAQAQQAANDRNRIIIDDAVNNQNPDPIVFGRGGNPLQANNTLRGGDTATGVTGVMTFTWAGNAASGNAYRLRPLQALNSAVPNFQPANPRPAGPPPVGGRLKVASFNVLNYFLTLDDGGQDCGPLNFKQECRGAETPSELTRQQDKLNQALLKLNGDVVGIVEVENSQDAQGADVNPLADIVNRLNGSLGGPVYAYITTGVIGTDTIRVGIIYKAATVVPVNAAMIDADPIHNRPPVAQLFAENGTGERFTVIVNHFKSKGTCPTPAVGPDADLGDGQACWNAQRVQQSQALISFINNTVLPTAADPDVLLIGDFNAYAKEDPIRTLQNAGFVDFVAQFGGATAYSYAFDGQWGYLDQGLGSASIVAQVTGAGDYHINADEPTVLDYNTNFKTAGQVVSCMPLTSSGHRITILSLSVCRSAPFRVTLIETATSILRTSC